MQYSHIPWLGWVHKPVREKRLKKFYRCESILKEMNISLFNITDLCLHPLLVVHWHVDNKQPILLDPIFWAHNGQGRTSERFLTLWPASDHTEMQTVELSPAPGTGRGLSLCHSAGIYPGPVPGSLTGRRLSLLGGLKFHSLLSQVLTKDYTYTYPSVGGGPWVRDIGQCWAFWERSQLTGPPVVSLPGKST